MNYNEMLYEAASKKEWEKVRELLKILRTVEEPENLSPDYGGRNALYFALISGEFAITGINRAHYAEVFFDWNGDRWFKVRIHFLTIEEKSGAEKRTLAKMLVQASNLEEALENFKKGMKGTMTDYVIIEVSETQLMDVFPYEEVKTN